MTDTYDQSPPDTGYDPAALFKNYTAMLDAERTPFTLRLGPTPPMKEVPGTHPHLHRAVSMPLTVLGRACSRLQSIGEWLADRLDDVSEWNISVRHRIRTWADHQEPDWDRFYKEHPELKHQQINTFYWGPGNIQKFDTDLTPYPDYALEDWDTPDLRPNTRKE